MGDVWPLDAVWELVFLLERFTDNPRYGRLQRELFYQRRPAATGAQTGQQGAVFIGWTIAGGVIGGRTAVRRLRVPDRVWRRSV